MVQMAGLKPGQQVIDLGAGDGRLLKEAVRACPGIHAIGIELVPTIWLLGWIKLRLSKSGRTVAWKMQNVMHTDMSKADVVFLYVLPRMMERLEEKFNSELRPGTVVISNTFTFPGKQAVEEQVIQGKTVRRYVWTGA